MKQSECDHPSCSNVALNTYTGDNGNSLNLCDRHYYNAVVDTDNSYSLDYSLQDAVRTVPDNSTSSNIQIELDDPNGIAKDISISD